MTKEQLFGMVQVLVPLIAKDTVSISPIDKHTIKLKLKNRNKLIFRYVSDKDWSITSEKKKNSH